jgi:hypothetical protein
MVYDFGPSALIPRDVSPSPQESGHLSGAAAPWPIFSNSDRESTSLNTSEFFSPDGAIAGPTALSSQIRTWRRQPWPNKE